MEPFVLKIAILTVFVCFNIITASEGVPLEEYRTTLAEWTDYNTFEPQGPGTYSFGYDIEDPEKDNIQFRDEERLPNGTVKGSYGYLRPDGMVQIVHYTADANGYRATFESYPRGQLKPLRDTNRVVDEPLSSALRSAIRSKNVYKRQHVQEQRLRPVDSKYAPSIVLASYTDSINDAYSTRDPSFSNYVNSNDDRTHYVNPYRIFVKSN